MLLIVIHPSVIGLGSARILGAESRPLRLSKIISAARGYTLGFCEKFFAIFHEKNRPREAGRKTHAPAVRGYTAMSC
jgi:hypothetical protein